MRAKRADANQVDIVKAFRKLGCTVEHLHTVGRGVPDLLVGHRALNHLVEVKSKKGRYTDDQKDWIAKWSGQVYTVSSIDDVVRLLKLWT